MIKKISVKIWTHLHNMRIVELRCWVIFFSLEIVSKCVWMGRMEFYVYIDWTGKGTHTHTLTHSKIGASKNRKGNMLNRTTRMGQANVLYVCFEVSIKFEPFIVLSNCVLFFVSLSSVFIFILLLFFYLILLFLFFSAALRRYLLLFTNFQYTQ